METTTYNLKSITTELSSTNAVVADLTTQLNGKVLILKPLIIE
jgi:hypothetical protein